MCTPAIWAILKLTSLLCLRVSQAARLVGRDFDLANKRVWVKEFKGAPAVRKPLFDPALAFVAYWKAHGSWNGGGNGSRGIK